jgi:hypothetical protein
MTNKKLSLTISAILGLFVIVTNANADLTISSKPAEQPKPVQPAPATTVATPVVATPVSSDPLVSGFGRDIPLEQALSQMLPSNDWKVNWFGTDEQVATMKAEKVSWNANNAPLTDTVNKVAVNAGNVATSIDFKNKTISVSSLASSTTVASGRVVKSVEPIAPVLLQPHSHPMIPVEQATPSDDSYVAVHPLVQTWVLDPSLTLRQNVEKWAKQANYTVVWQASDYRIYGHMVFTGEFDADNGPITQVLSQYEHSDQPLKGNMTVRDRVLFVHNKNWDMPTVIPVNSNDDVTPDLNGHDAPKNLPDVSKEAAKHYDPYQSNAESTNSTPPSN